MKTLVKKINISLAAMFFTAGMANAGTITYSFDGEFDGGILNGVNHNPPFNNQLQLNTTGTTFPYLWVANAGDHTFSKINTDGNGCEEARYYTFWSTQGASNSAFSGPAPSRTAVDVNGDVYLANRHFSSGRMPDLIKFSSEGGVDRNGNGVIDTSTDTNGDCTIDASEMLPVIDDGDGILDIDDFADERVIWVRQFGTGSSLGRSLCLDNDGDIWAGTYSSREYYKFDENGNLLVGPGGSETDTSPGTGGVNTAQSNYGCAVDASGTLWGATLGSGLVKLDTTTNSHTTNFFGSGNYGIALGNDKVYLGSTLRSFDPTSSTFDPTTASSGTGVAVDGDGAVWFGTPTLRKFEVIPATGLLDPTPVCSVGTLGSRGPIIDKDGNVWTINTTSNSVSQYDTNCVFISTIPVGLDPYTYSDATGLGARTQTDPSGIWTITRNSGAAGTVWEKINWNNEPEGSEPAGTSITVEARASDTLVALATTAYAAVTNDMPGLGLTGQFIQVRTVLRPNAAGDSPILSDLSLVSQDDTDCDLNGDQQVDRLDINMFRGHRNTLVPPGDPALDINGDGRINVVDGRLCALQCTNANCAP